MTPDLFGIGLAGKSLTELEREILRQSPPYAVVLFARNIDSAAQTRDLIAEIKSCSATPPLLMIDQEGGRVDRLRHILPGLPSAEAFAEGERAAELSEWHGRVTGMALRHLGIEVDLAPVVDIRGQAAPKGLERRTFGSDPESVTELAGAFMRGLHQSGVASCLKHWPGIGAGSGDSHYGASVIDRSLDEMLARDLVPFARLAGEAAGVMISHGTYPHLAEAPNLPATLSWQVTTRVLRQVIGFQGLAVSDDMEMHAVSDLGSYEDISERALMAGNDVILYCSHIERVPDLQRHLRQRAAEDAQVRARFDDALRRCDAYRDHCLRLREDAPVAPEWDVVVSEAARFVEEFRSAQPEHSAVLSEEQRPQGGSGRTGREEWT